MTAPEGATREAGPMLSFPEVPGEGPIERTKRLLAVYPHMRDDVAYKAWLEANDERSSAVQRAAWDSLSEVMREGWYETAYAQLEAFWAMTPAEQAEYNAASWRTTLRRNDRAYAALAAPHPTPKDSQ